MQISLVQDVISAVFAAIAPGSTAANDARRLGADECGGRVSAVDFLVDLPPESALAAANDLRDAGFAVAPRTDMPDGFLVVRAHVPLRPYHLHRVTRRLTRIVSPYAGLAIAVTSALVSAGASRGLAA